MLDARSYVSKCLTPLCRENPDIGLSESLCTKLMKSDPCVESISVIAIFSKPSGRGNRDPGIDPHRHTRKIDNHTPSLSAIWEKQEACTSIMHIITSSDMKNRRNVSRCLNLVKPKEGLFRGNFVSAEDNVKRLKKRKMADFLAFLSMY